MPGCPQPAQGGKLVTPAEAPVQAQEGEKQQQQPSGCMPGETDAPPSVVLSRRFSDDSVTDVADVWSCTSYSHATQSLVVYG